MLKEVEQEIDMFLEENSTEIDSDAVQLAVGDIEKVYLSSKDNFLNFDRSHELMADIVRLGRKLQSVLNKLYTKQPENPSPQKVSQSSSPSSNKVKDWLGKSESNLSTLSGAQTAIPRNTSRQSLKKTSSISTDSKSTRRAPGKSRIPVRSKSVSRSSNYNFVSTQDSGIGKTQELNKSPQVFIKTDSKIRRISSSSSSSKPPLPPRPQSKISAVSYNFAPSKKPMEITLSSKNTAVKVTPKPEMCSKQVGTEFKSQERRTSTGTFDDHDMQKITDINHSQIRETQKNQKLLEEMRSIRNEVQTLVRTQSMQNLSTTSNNSYSFQQVPIMQPVVMTPSNFSNHSDVNVIKSLRSEVKKLRKRVERNKKARYKTEPLRAEHRTKSQDQIVIIAPGPCEVADIQDVTNTPLKRSFSLKNMSSKDTYSLGFIDQLRELVPGIRKRNQSSGDQSSLFGGSSASNQRLVDAFERAEIAARRLDKNSRLASKSCRHIVV